MCSTQKVNGNCQLTFDRLDPVTLPTIQLRPNARISVSLTRSLPYELITLDPQSFQLIAPADQVQGLASAILPSFKGVGTPTQTPVPGAFGILAADSNDVQTVKNDLVNLSKLIDNPFPALSTFITNVQGVYAQLDEAVAPLPRPLDDHDNPLRVSNLPKGTPTPWSTSYPSWRSLVLCELSASECSSESIPVFKDLMATGITLQTMLTPPATPPQAPPPLKFDSATFDALVATTKVDIAKLKPSDNPNQYTTALAELQSRETSLLPLVPVYAAAWLPGVTAVNKDLQTYFVNIKETVASAPGSATQFLGFINDPRHLSNNTGTATKFLGRQVTYAVNAVNQIAVMTTAVPTSSQKSSIVTITVLYADPIFEVSTGAILSTLPDRTFANQTLVTGNSGNLQTTGNVIISQSIIRPIVLPYAAGNWRIGHDFLMPDRHRGAVYATTALAFNGYNTTAEYAAGPSLSWRMLMFSPLVHFGHDIRLTQGETVNQVVCTTVPSQTNTCVGTPPPPSSTTFWKASFAFGIGVRVPTSFGTTTGR